MKTQRKSPGAARPRPRVAALIVAACAVAAVSAVVTFAPRLRARGAASPARTAALAAKYAQPFPIPQLRGTLSPASPYRAGVEAYRRREFRLAAEKFGLLSRDAGRWPGLHFYRGLSLLFAGEPALAAAAFREHLARHAEAAPARWYLALALLQSGRAAEAKLELEAIERSAEAEYSAQARALLDELR
jgi:hypothetical protein